MELRGGGHAASPVSAYPAEVFQHVPKELPCPFGHLSAAQPSRRAPRPHKCSACANDEPGPGAATQELALTKICPSLPTAHFGAGTAAETPSFCSRRGTKKKEKGRAVDVATATECLHVSYVFVVISHAAGPAAPIHPPQRHVKQPAAPGRRAGRAAGRRNHALLRGEVDGPDRGDTVDEETAKRKGEDAPRRAVLHGAAAAGHRPGPSR